MPESAAYHDEEARAVRNFTPWVIAGIAAILISYVNVKGVLYGIATVQEL